MKWLGLALGRLEPYDHLVFAWNGLTLHLEGMYLVNFWPLMLIVRMHLWWAQVLGLEWFKKQFSVSIPSRVQLQAFGFEFIHNIQGSNNHDELKHWTWIIMVQTTAKQMHNEMQFTWTDLKVGSMGHCNMDTRWVKGPHKLGRRTSQLVLLGAPRWSKRYSLSLWTTIA